VQEIKDRAETISLPCSRGSPDFGVLEKQKEAPAHLPCASSARIIAASLDLE
jgi:hypothetical protein